MIKLLKISFLMLVLLVNVSLAYAGGKYSIKQMTPEVQSALDNRRERFEQLDQLKTAGAIGENNKGYVDVLADQGEATVIAAAENTDRKVIYQTIADQNGLEDALGTIETVFAQVQFDKADVGDKVQTTEGQWVAK